MEQVRNYGGIALGCSVVKVFVRVLVRRLEKFAEDRILTEMQGGFRSGRRCSDQWLMLRGVCEVRKRAKKNSYLASLDISKAYDSVWREELWHKMRQYGVEEKLVRVCEGLYSGVEMRVVLNGGKSRWFVVERGIGKKVPCRHSYLTSTLWEWQRNW